MVSEIIGVAGVETRLELIWCGVLADVGGGWGGGVIDMTDVGRITTSGCRTEPSRVTRDFATQFFVYAFIVLDLN